MVAKRITILLGNYEKVEFGRELLRLWWGEKLAGRELWQEVYASLHLNPSAFRKRRRSFFRWLIPHLVLYYTDPEFRADLDKIESEINAALSLLRRFERAA